MRHFLATIFALLLVCAAHAGETTLTGWVSDAHCGALHTKPGGEDCVRKCIQGGEHLNPEWKPQKMVFVADEDKKVWFVDNPEMLKGQEGKHLELRARLDGKKNSVRVIGFTPVKANPKD